MRSKSCRTDTSVRCLQSAIHSAEFHRGSDLLNMAQIDDLSDYIPPTLFSELEAIGVSNIDNAQIFVCPRADVEDKTAFVGQARYPSAHQVLE